MISTPRNVYNSTHPMTLGMRGSVRVGTGSSTYVCNGTNGSNGSNGEDGLSASVSAEPLR
jgi:hypothetical protein